MKFNLDQSPFTQKETKSTREPMSATTQMTAMLIHGGASSPLDKAATEQRFLRMAATTSSVTEDSAKKMANTFSEKMKNFFFRLVEGKPYDIPDSLIKYLTEINTGVVFAQPNEEFIDNKKIPTFMTFVGQFIDHDLTLNPIDLIGTGGDPGDSDNGASPFIDLDSVYGSREHLVNGDLWHIINNTDGKFKLRKLADDAYDLPRSSDGKAYIFDARNDENQLILQIHILIMRLHNKIAKKFDKPDPNDPESVSQFVTDVKKEVLRNWQSFIWNQYLTALVNEEPREWAKKKVTSTKAPAKIGMPHEFSIGFRMGHSQLRKHYKLNKKNGFDLFDGTPNGTSDLRGSKPLTKERIIDWKFFTSFDQSQQTTNKIDGKVTSAVFVLPESAIPDNNKERKNLPERNLLRSNQVKLASAEDLLDFYKLPNVKRLQPDQIEKDKEKQKLFISQGKFKTPLWYYILKEAEIFNNGGEQLSFLGGRIVAEVIAGAIRYQPDSFLSEPGWKSIITGSNNVTFDDIIKYVKD